MEKGKAVNPWGIVGFLILYHRGILFHREGIEPWFGKILTEAWYNLLGPHVRASQLHIPQDVTRSFFKKKMNHSSPNNFANPGSLFYSRPSVLHHEVTVLNL